MHLPKRSYLMVAGTVLLAVALGFSATVYAGHPDPITIPERTSRGESWTRANPDT